MRKFILLLLCAAAWAQQDIHILGAHAPQVMQKTGNVTTSGTTVTATMTTSPSPTVTAATGTTLVAICGVNNTGTIAVSDNNSNTWNTAKSQTGTVAGVLIAFVPAPNSGATTVTCTAGTTGVVTVQLYEVFGFLAQVEAQPDSTDSNTASAQTSALLSAAGLTQQTPNEIAIVGLMLTTNNACTAASGWTIDTQQAATGGRLCPARQALPVLNGVAGSNSVATFTSASYALAAATFKPIMLSIGGLVKANIQTNAAINEAQVGGNNIAADTNGRQIVKSYPDTGTTSYHASKKFAASSTTDNAVMPGNATNTVLVTRVLVTCTETTAGNISVELLKRSAADTAGTSAAITAIPDDANYASAVSAPLSYTGTGPSVGTPVGDLDNAQIGCMAAATASPNDIYVFSPAKPIVLRGTAQQIAVNVGNAAITGGNVTVTFEWMETTTP
jgi:hypothetical protein